jgi:uncharacterized membrane protein
MSDPLTDDKKPQRSLGRSLRTYFLTGLVVTGPIGITILLISWFIDLLDGWFKPLIPASLQPSAYLPYDLPGIGLLLAVVIVFIVGGLTASLFGRTLVRFGESIIAQTPVAGTSYTALRQIFQAAVDNGQRSFSQVALIEYPRKGIWAVGFVTNDTKGEIADHIGEDAVSIFLPTTPNPTSGFLLFLPKSDVKILDISVEEGARLVISAGMSVGGNETGGNTETNHPDSK